MISCTDSDLDVVSKIFDTGVAKAAKSLSVLVKHDVVLSVPNLCIIQAIDLVSDLCMTADSVCGVVKRLLEPLESYALILLPKHQALDLVQYVTPQDFPVDDLPVFHADAMIEIGNILIGACLGSIADTFGIPFNLDQPVTYIDQPSDYFLRSIVVDDLCEYFLSIRLSMAVKKTPLTICWDFLLPDNSIDFLRHHMARLPNLAR